jgi:hypothetical protein
VCGNWCQCSVHAAIAASLDSFFWLLMVCSSIRLVRSAIWAASSASCFALLKPTKGIFLGSHSRAMLALGKVSRRVLSLQSIHRDSSWSSCGDTSSALFMAAPDAREMMMGFCCWAGSLSRKVVSTSSPECRAHKIASGSVTICPMILSVCLRSFPSW